MVSRLKIACGMLGLFLVVGCNNGSNKTPDAAIPDGPTADAPGPDAMLADAGPPDASGADAAVATATGNVSLTDLTVINPAAVKGAQGAALSASFQAITPSKVAGNNFVSGTATNGCTAALYDMSAGDTFPTDLDEGALTVTIQPGGGAADAGVTSTTLGCAFANGQYICPVGSGGSGTATPSATLPTNTVTFSDTTNAPFSAASVGHQILDTSAGMAYPIVGYDSTSAGTTVAIVAPAIAAGGTPVTIASYQELAAAGPIPFVVTDFTTGSMSAAPDFFNSGDMVAFALAGGSEFDPSSATVGVGDAFTLDSTTNSQSFLTGTLPATPTDQTITTTGGTAFGTIVTFTATDTATSGLTDMPAPTSKYLTGHCVSVPGASVMLPKNLITLMETTKWSRIEWIVLRVKFTTEANSTNPVPNTVYYLAGHGLVSFVDKPNG